MVREITFFDKEVKVTIRITSAQMSQIKEIIREDPFSFPSTSDFIRGAIARRIASLKYKKDY